MSKHRIYTSSVASVYPHYLAKAEKKGRTKAEVDEIICWLTGYSQEELEKLLNNKTDFETFFLKAPRLNPSRALIKGLICGVRIEEIEEPTMREIRYLDKIDRRVGEGENYGQNFAEAIGIMLTNRAGSKFSPNDSYLIDAQCVL